MHVSRLVLKNWKCYRGEHSLDLGPKAYAVIAIREEDRDSSNWAGKSSLLQAIDWVLFGRLPEDAGGKDDVITRGESKVEVTLELSGGARVTRSKERNRPERLWFWPEGGGQPAMKDEAQVGVVSALGLDAADFVNTSYFRQREMARFILQDPAERLSTVSGWLRLEPLERAEEIARSRLQDALGRLQEAERGIRLAQEQEASAARFLSERPKVSQLEGEISALRAVISGAERRVAETREREVLEKQAASYLEVVDEGKRLVAVTPPTVEIHEMEKRVEVLLSEVRDASDVATSTRNAYEERRRLIAKFDGICPLVRGSCPSSEWVTGKCEDASRLANEAKEAHDDAVETLSVVSEEHARAKMRHREAEANLARIRHLREVALKLKPAYDRLGLREDVFAQDVRELRQKEQVLVHQLVEIKHQARLQEEARGAAFLLVEKIEEARKEVDVAREAVLVFGKTGAQRRVAERALDRIGDGATEMLAEAGVPLSVSLRWSREGRGLASHCPDCGSPFPASARVKECERCAAPRGPKLVHQLDVVLSDRSGAAEDLAAFALQMSASAWLRRERDSAWSVLLLDEPTGQLDASNRRAITAHLARLFAHSGISQAFVVAHHASVLESLPGRILITAGKGGSRVSVTT